MLALWQRIGQAKYSAAGRLGIVCDRLGSTLLGGVALTYWGFCANIKK